MTDSGTTPQVGQVVERLLNEHLYELNIQIQELTAKSDRKPEARPRKSITTKPNKAALAQLMHMGSKRLGRLLKDELPWSVGELGRIAEILGLPDDERTRLVALGRRRVELDRLRRRPTTAQVSSAERQELFALNRWSTDRPFTTETLRLRVLTSPVSFHRAQFEPHLEAVRDAEGTLAVVRRIGELDWHESATQTTYNIDISGAEYSHVRANRALLRDDHGIYDTVIRAATEGDAGEIVRLLPFTSIAGNVNLVTADNRFALAQRSGLVHTYKNEWNVGINEGMKVTSARPDTEDFFDLVKRALDEELGVARDTITEVVINWFGFCADCPNFYVFSHARTNMTADEVRYAKEHKASHGNVELAALAFPRLDAKALENLQNGIAPGEVSTGVWLHHSKLSAQLLAEAFL